MPCVRCGFHDRVVPHAPEDDAGLTSDQAAESPTRNGLTNTRLFQATGTLPIVQTYCVAGAVPKGSWFERREGLAPGSSLGKNSFGVCAGWGGREGFLSLTKKSNIRKLEDKLASAYSWRRAFSGSILTERRAGR